MIYDDAFLRSPEEEARLGVRYVLFPTLLETADVVSLHVPLNDSTRHLIDAEALYAGLPAATPVTANPAHRADPACRMIGA